MAITIEELAAKLSDDPVEAFIGCGASGQTETFDIRHARADAAAAKYGQGI